MGHLLKLAAALLPVFFAFAFLVPVIDQSMQALAVTPPFGLSTDMHRPAL